MKKRVIIIASTLLLLLITIVLILNSKYKVVIHTDIHIPYGFGEEPVVIKEYEEYQTYIAPLMESAMLDAKFKKNLSSYDESFFEKSMLVLICYTEGSSTTKVSVSSVKVEETTVHVTIKRMLAHGSTDLSMDLGIVIELPKDENVSKVEYTTVK